MMANDNRELSRREFKKKKDSYLKAAESGDLKTFKGCQKYVSISRCFTWRTRDTALHLAARCGHTHIVTEIFSKDGHACKNLKNSRGCTALHEAVRNGHFAIVKILAENDVDYNLVTKKGYTALHEAVKNGHRDVVSKLLEKNVDLNAVTNWSGSTALHKAAKNGCADITRQLVEKGADVNKCDKDGRIPLHHACDVKAYECVIALLNGQNVLLDVHDKEGLTPLHVASSREFKQIVEVLVNKLKQLNKAGDINSQCRAGRTALHYAVKAKNAEIVRLLLQLDADKTLTDSKGQSPLAYASSARQSHIVSLLQKENVPVMPPQNAAAVDIVNDAVVQN